MTEDKKKKITTVMMFITIVLFTLIFIKTQILGGSSKKNDEVEIKDIEISYVVPDDNIYCYLMIKNPNDFAVDVSGTITKYDENKVIDDDAEDDLDMTLRANQTYIMQSRNPNNSIARQNNLSINYKDNLTINKSKNDNDYANNIDISLELNKQNDMGKSLIIYKNNNKKVVDIDGYIVFYDDANKSNISYISEFTVEDLKAGEEFRDYINVKQSSSDELNYNYNIYLNDIN